MLSIIKKNLPFPLKSRFISSVLHFRKKVDFAVAGFPKCATTSIGKNIASVPGIFLPDYEIQMRHLMTGRTPKCGKQDLFGIRNPNLIYELHNLKALINGNPDIRIIISLREPVSWLYSFYQYRQLEVQNNALWLKRRIQKNPELANIGFDDIVYNGKDLMGAGIEKGNFFKYLKNLLKYLPPPQILILFLEELSLHPVKTYEKIFRFLNVNHHPAPAEPVKANEKKMLYEPEELYRHQLKYLQSYYAPMKKRLNGLLESRWGIDNSYW